VSYQSFECACIKGRKEVMNQKAVYEELKRIVCHLPKYHTKILLGDFNAKVGRGNNSKPTIGNGSLHQDSKDNVVRNANFAKSKSLVVKAVQVVRMREGRGAYMVLVGKPNGKRLLGRPRRREEDNIKTDLQDVFYWGHGLD
jgi:RNase P/RNase MRP subunit p29